MLTLAQHVNCDVDGNISWDQGAHARKGKESEATSIKRNGTSDNHIVASRDDITIVPVKDEEKPPQDTCSGNLHAHASLSSLLPISGTTKCPSLLLSSSLFFRWAFFHPLFLFLRTHKFSTSLNLSVPACVFR